MTYARQGALPLLALLSASAMLACMDTRRDVKQSLPEPTPPPKDVASAPHYPVSAAFCADTVEAAALRCAEGAVTRHGDTLVIGLSGVGAVKRVNLPEDGERYAHYQYAGRLGGGSGTPAYHLLDEQFWEANVVELINAGTGDSLMLAGMPVLSPDGARFAVAEEGTAECGRSDRLALWRITGDRPVSEYTIEPFDCDRELGWWPTDISWRSPDTVSFLRNTLPRDAARRARDESDTTRAMLVRRGDRWELTPASATPAPKR